MLTAWAPQEVMRLVALVPLEEREEQVFKGAPQTVVLEARGGLVLLAVAAVAAVALS